MFRFFYSVILTLAVPLILLRLLLRSLRAPAYRQRIGERFARFDLPERFDVSARTIWIHGVSVGETVAAAPLIEQLRIRYPDAQLYFTTMTATGSDRVTTLFGDMVFHSYLPYDLPWALNRFINRINPELLILMETELWPNLIHACSHRGVKIFLANARLSEKSMHSYGRFSGTTKTMLGQIDRIAAQAQADADRFESLGARSDSIQVTGSLKFNVSGNEEEQKAGEPFDSIKESGRTVIIAASTREGEEAKVLTAFRSVLERVSSLLLILVPRHPERFDSVMSLCEERGFKAQRRSGGQPLTADTNIVLGDSMGEMPVYYGLANIAFVGGSLVDTGCQNVLEPAALALPVVVGPSQYNFATICSQLEEAGALHTVQNELELADFLLTLNEDERLRQQMGSAGSEFIQANQQALPDQLEIIEELLAKATD